MRLVQGYEYAAGVKPDIDLGAMQAVCSELTAGPLLRGSLNVSVLCPSTRMLARWSDAEMGVSRCPLNTLSDGGRGFRHLS